MSTIKSISDPLVCEINLDHDRVVLVDLADYRYLRLFTWRAITYGSDKWYAVTRAPALKRDVMMHRIILDPEDGVHVDHANGNGLDNRRSNLRLATPAQNAANRKSRRGSTSRFKGVFWSKAHNRFIARIYSGGRDVHLGTFRSEYDAARAYNRAATEVYGEFAYLNPVADFPEQDPKRGGRKPRPWFWEARDRWCVDINRKRHVLARGKENETIAIEAFDRLMAKHPQREP